MPLSWGLKVASGTGGTGALTSTEDPFMHWGRFLLKKTALCPSPCPHCLWWSQAGLRLFPRGLAELRVSYTPAVVVA